ncbi:MAG: putative Ig domain-containing protein, partial [Betaproteobacteria bacterium]|nr:putative Ig domain-containing protein [Betaproteobacteria bacterium]
MRSLLKGIIASLLGIIGLTVALSAHAAPDYTIERLSLFIYDGTNSYEDRRLPTVVSNLPAGLTVTFNEVIAANQDRTWTWTFRNTNAAALTNLRVTGFVDPDLSATTNTYFNEYGEIIALSAPAGYIAADRWEIGEPGYLTGDLLPRAAEGNLNNVTTLTAANLDDAAMALSLPIGTLEPDQTLTVTATLSATGIAGLKQIDADDGSQVVFQLYAQKGLVSPPSATSDYHVTITTATPSVTVGDTVNYQIVIGNNGQDDGDGVTLTDTIPAAITNVTWTCSGTGSATCGALNGSGNVISLSGQIPEGAANSLTITVTGTANATGTVTNTATIAPQGSTVDPDTSNNTSSVNVAINAPAAPQADLQITLATSTPLVNIGDDVNYQIVVTNKGTSDVTGAQITDAIPAAIDSIFWSCTGSKNAACGTPIGGGNSINLTAQIPVNGIITIDVTGKASAIGPITNTATVAPPAGVTDPDMSNNSSTVMLTAIGINPTNALPQPIPSGSLGMLVLLGLLLVGAAGLCIKPLRRTLLPVLLLIVFLGGTCSFTLEGHAASLTPDPLTVELIEGQTIDVTRVVTLDSTGPATKKLDIILLSDTTGSMGGTINSVKTNARYILAALSGGDSRFADIDIAVGVANYWGDPSEYPSSTKESVVEQSYNLGQPLTKNLADVETAINQWSADGGGDGPEGNFFALQQLATSGASTDGKEPADEGFASGAIPGWRDGARRLVILFGDSPSHEEVCNICETMRALHDNGVTVALVNTVEANQGIDQQGQASVIAQASNGSLFYGVDNSSAVVDAIFTAAESATSTINLSLESIGDTSGLGITFRCGDALGCDNVPSGETRNFTMTIKGVNSGLYSFRTQVAAQHSIFAQDTVKVRSCSGYPRSRVKPLQVQLVWEDTGAAQYGIYRSEAVDGPYTLIARSGSRYATYLDRTVVADTEYFYQVREQNAAGEDLCQSRIVTGRAPSVDALVAHQPNRPPLFISKPVKKGLVGNEYLYALSGYDPDASDTISFSLTQGPAGMTLNGNTLQWMPDVEGNYSVTVEVRDSRGGTATQSFEIVVRNAPNIPPQIVSQPTLIAAVDVSYLYTVLAEDADPATLIYSLNQAPVGMTIGSNGQVQWTPTTADIGLHPVTIVVIDGAGDFVTQSYTLEVRGSNRPPVITSTPITQGYEGIDYEYQVTAVDPDGDRPLYRLLSAPSGMTIDFNGKIHWLPPTTLVGLTGSYKATIEIEVLDVYCGSVKQSYTLEIKGGPEFTSRPIINTSIGESYRYQPAATDPDNTALTYGLLEGPTNMTVDPTTGLVTWVATSSTPTTYSIKLQVRNVYGLTGEQSYNLRISDQPNRAPYFTGTPVVYVAYPSIYYYTATATDPDSDALTWALRQCPVGMAINETNGAISWKPELTTKGSFTVEVEVSDRRGGVATQTFDVQVPVSDNHPPQITSNPTASVSAGSTYTYTISANDPDGELVTLSLLDGPANMQLNGNVLTWTTAIADVGLHNVQIEARDPRDGWATQTWVLDVVPAIANRPPTISSTPPITGTAGTTYTYQVSASDPDGDVRIFSLIVAPVGMTISTAGKVEWPIPAGTAGSFDVEIEVADNKGAYVRQSYSIGVGVTGNQPPRITSTPGTQTKEGLTYSYTISASDPDSEPVTLSLLDGPVGMQLNGNVLIWATTVADIGPHNVQIEARDPRGGWASQAWTLVVVSATTNRSPTISSTPSMAATAGTTYTYQVTASDPDGDPLTYTLNDAPTSMTISATGKVEWAIPVGTAGAFDVEIEVADNKGAYVRQSYTIGVGGVGNRPPTISSTPSMTGTAGVTYTYQVTASDPDSDPLTYTLSAAPTGMTISAIGRIEWPIPAGTVGVFDVEIKVTDSKGAYARQSYSIGVGITGNRPPTISSNPPLTGTAGVTYVYQISASDPDGDPRTYTLNTAPVGMTVNATGRIEWPIPVGTDGVFDVEIEVSDGRGGYVRQNYTIAVGSSNIGNRPPRVTSTPGVTGTAGGSYTYQVTATDPDGDTLAYTLKTAPDDMTISAAGKIEWLIPIDAIGDIDVEIEVADGKGGFAYQGYAISVAGKGNRAPRITSTPTTTGTAGGSYTYQVSATDPDGDTLTYTLSTAPTGMIISGTGKVEWPIPASVIGDINVEIEVTDNKGGFARQSYTISVAGSGNRAPRITSTPTTTAYIGTLYAYQVSATDPDSDPLTFALVDGPTGMILFATNRIEWTPTTAQNGYYDVAVTVSDGRGGSSMQTWTIYAQLATNSPPRITSQPIYHGKPGEEYQYNVVAYDANSDPLTYSLIEGPTGMTISSTGVVDWLNPITGSYTVTIKVNDTHGAFVTQSYTLQIAVNSPPEINSTAPTSAAVGVLYSYQVVAIDPDGDFLTYQLVTRPTGMTINSTTGLIEWTPTYTGNNNVTVRVSDGQATAEQSYTLAVSAAPPINTPPNITSTPVTDGTEGVAYSYQVVATDSNGDTLTYSFTGAPIGMSIDNTGLITWASPIAGSYDITVHVSDGKATTDQSYTLTVSAAPPINTPPNINSTPITIGAEGTTYSYQVMATDAEHDPLTYSLSGAPTGMSIDNSGLITWPSPVAGSYDITVHVSDGKATTDQSFTLVISAVSPPSIVVNVNMTQPTTGSVFTQNSTISLKATASATGGTISKLEFLNGSTELGTGALSGGEYTYGWSATAGDYNVFARATDNLNNTHDSSPVGIKVCAPPTLAFTNPSDGASTVAPGEWTLEATASTASGCGAIAKVEFYNGSQLLYTATNAPYSYLWQNISQGDYTLTAKATDSLGGTSEQSINVSVTAAPPTTEITLVSPTDGSAYPSGTAVPLAATTNLSPSEVKSVEFFADAGTSSVATGALNAGQYTATWSAPVGSHTVFARLTDNTNNTFDSSKANITVAASCDPTVSLTSPVNGTTATQPGPLTLTAQATAPCGTIAKVEFYNGTYLLSTVTSAPYTYTWQSIPSGSYTLTAKATTDSGSSMVSAAVQVTVESDEPAPKLIVLSPADGATVNDTVATVTGTFTYSPDAAIIANGQVAKINTDGSFTIYNVPLQAGSNTITVVLNTLNHDPVTQDVTVTSAGTPPITVNLSPANGLAPLETTLSVQPQQGDSFANYCLALAYSKDGGAMADIFALEDASKRISTTNQASFSFTFTDAGTYTVYI